MIFAITNDLCNDGEINIWDKWNKKTWSSFWISDPDFVSISVTYRQAFLGKNEAQGQSLTDDLDIFSTTNKANTLSIAVLCDRKSDPQDLTDWSTDYMLCKTYCATVLRALLIK